MPKFLTQIDKHNFSLQIRTKIEEIITKYGDYIDVTKKGDDIITFLDNKRHEYFFQLMPAQNSRHLIAFKPGSELKIGQNSLVIPLQEVDKYFNYWIELITKMHAPSPLDDSTQKFFDEFYVIFHSIDEDSKTTNLSFAQQVKMLTYFEKVEAIIIESDIIIQDKSELVANIETLKDAIQTESKDSVIQKVILFWAKTRKARVKVAYKIIEIFFTETVKMGLKMAFEIETDDWKNMLGF